MSTQPTDRFAVCAAHTAILEGGWSDDPYDPGGPTMKGITIRVYAGFLGVKLDHKDGPIWTKVKARLRNITDAEVLTIYKRNYWDLVRAAEMPAGVDLAAWDLALNAGPVQAVRCMQRVLGVTVDGHIGAATMGAVQERNPPDLIRAYLAERRRFHRSLKTFWRFGKGWMSRCDYVEATALEMAMGGHTTDVTAAPAPLPNADAQSASQGKATATEPKPPWITEILLVLTGGGTNVVGFSSAFNKWGAKPDATWLEIAFFFLAEPLVLTGVVTTMAALTTLLYRRRAAQ